MKIDMDKTIADMLKKYRAYVGTLIEREEKDIDKIKDNIDYELAQQDFLNLKRADDFLKLIVEDPKKYLYRSNSIILTSVDNNNNPCDYVPNLPSIYGKLQPIVDLEHKYDIVHVLHSLSLYISYHVKKASTEAPWIYESCNIKFCGELAWRKNYDCNAQEILNWNKYVNLLSLNGLERKFKELLPARRFAIKQGKQR